MSRFSVADLIKAQVLCFDFFYYIFLTTVSFTTWLTLIYLCYSTLIYTAVNTPSVMYKMNAVFFI